MKLSLGNLVIISHKYKFIYIKARKVAGTSTEILLDRYCGDDDIVTDIAREDSLQYPFHNPRNAEKFINHDTAKNIRQKIGSDIFDSYFKFMNIRNPWDLTVSRYWWNLHGRHRLDSNCSFEMFITHHLKYTSTDSLLNYCAIDGKSILNGVIRYENLYEDTLEIMKKMGMPIEPSRKYPKTKSKSRANSRPYWEYYDDKTRAIVAMKYKKDIEHFGYSFGPDGGSQLQDPLRQFSIERNGKT